MDYYKLTNIQLFGIISLGIGIMICLFKFPNKKRSFKDIIDDNNDEKKLLKNKNTKKSEENPTKRLRSMSSMEKLNTFSEHIALENNHYSSTQKESPRVMNTFFDIEENKTVHISNIKSKSTHNILNEKEYEIENIRTNFEKYKIQCGICKTLIPSFKEVYCYMDNRFCSEGCREHYYKVQNDNYKRRFSL